MSFAVGSLVKALGREWVVQPESTDLLLHVLPDFAYVHGTNKVAVYARLDGPPLPPPGRRRIADDRSHNQMIDPIIRKENSRQPPNSG